MSETRWTPGPWRVGQLESYDAPSGAPFRCVYRSDDETASTRINVWGGDRNQESVVTFDCDADARLIAAAPALYDALEAIHRELVRQEINFGPLIADAEDALRLARGGPEE